MNHNQNALLIFSEELAEVAVELLQLQNHVSKAIRFGIDEVRDLPTSNRERIEQEWNDLLGSIAVLSERGINLNTNVEAVQNKIRKIKKYTDYSVQLGQVRSD